MKEEINLMERSTETKLHFRGNTVTLGLFQYNYMIRFDKSPGRRKKIEIASRNLNGVTASFGLKHNTENPQMQQRTKNRRQYELTNGKHGRQCTVKCKVRLYFSAFKALV